MSVFDDLLAFFVEGFCCVTGDSKGALDSTYLFSHRSAWLCRRCFRRILLRFCRKLCGVRPTSPWTWPASSKDLEVCLRLESRNRRPGTKDMDGRKWWRRPQATFWPH